MIYILLYIFYIYYDIYYYDIIWYNRSLPYSLFIRYILEPQWKSSSHLVGCTSKSQTEEASWERHRRTSSSEQCSCIVFELQGARAPWSRRKWTTIPFPAGSWGNLATGWSQDDMARVKIEGKENMAETTAEAQDHPLKHLSSFRSMYDSSFLRVKSSRSTFSCLILLFGFRASICTWLARRDMNLRSRKKGSDSRTSMSSLEGSCQMKWRVWGKSTFMALGPREMR